MAETTVISTNIGDPKVNRFVEELTSRLREQIGDEITKGLNAREKEELTDKGVNRVLRNKKARKVEESLSDKVSDKVVKKTFKSTKKALDDLHNDIRKFSRQNEGFFDQFSKKTKATFEKTFNLYLPKKITREDIEKTESELKDTKALSNAIEKAFNKTNLINEVIDIGKIRTQETIDDIRSQIFDHLKVTQLNRDDPLFIEISEKMADIKSGFTNAIESETSLKDAFKEIQDLVNHSNDEIIKATLSVDSIVNDIRGRLVDDALENEKAEVITIAALRESQEFQTTQIGKMISLTGVDQQKIANIVFDIQKAQISDEQISARIREEMLPALDIQSLEIGSAISEKEKNRQDDIVKRKLSFDFLGESLKTKTNLLSDQLKLQRKSAGIFESKTFEILKFMTSPVWFPIKKIFVGVEHLVKNVIGDLWSDIKKLNPWNSFLDFLLSPAGIVSMMFIAAWFKYKVWPWIKTFFQPAINFLENTLKPWWNDTWLPFWKDTLKPSLLWVLEISKEIKNDISGWFKKQFPDTTSGFNTTWVLIKSISYQLYSVVTTITDLFVILKNWLVGWFDIWVVNPLKFAVDTLKNIPLLFKGPFGIMEFGSKLKTDIKTLIENESTVANDFTADFSKRFEAWSARYEALAEIESKYTSDEFIRLNKEFHESHLETQQKLKKLEIVTPTINIEKSSQNVEDLWGRKPIDKNTQNAIYSFTDSIDANTKEVTGIAGRLSVIEKKLGVVASNTVDIKNTKPPQPINRTSINPIGRESLFREIESLVPAY